ncbi:hypothetical protein [Enterococcus sp. DIV0756]|uniref:hypothetical protein n=1 Tax=Enterococcus sp. DIV0756 TaxID=2774636 RepID=UPI003F28CB5B
MIPLNLYQKLFLTMKASTFVEYIPLATDFVQWFFLLSDQEYEGMSYRLKII